MNFCTLTSILLENALCSYSAFSTQQASKYVGDLVAAAWRNSLLAWPNAIQYALLHRLQGPDQLRTLECWHLTLSTRMAAAASVCTGNLVL